MLLLQRASAPSTSHGKIGLAIAGGGPLGGIYELGALRALELATEGLNLTRVDVSVGVSSGAFLAAGLANRMSTADICRIFITGDSDDVRFRPAQFVRPALFEYVRRAAGLPRIMLDWCATLLAEPTDSRLSDLIGHFGGLIPIGLFDNSGVERFLHELFTQRGRTNDFRELARPLYVASVDLDTGEAIRFGSKGWDDIPISKALQASSALPGLYPPVDIRGRHFVDGALRRTMNASAVLDHGIDLLLAVNPLVPFDTNSAAIRNKRSVDRIAQGGLPVVLSQTFRTLLQSRVEVGLAKYAEMYPKVDQIVLEPNADDSEMFFTNLFSYSSRRRMCEHAYRSTLADLRARRDVLGPVFARHGLKLRDAVLDDPHPSLIKGLPPMPSATETTAQLRHALDSVDDLIATRTRSTKRRGSQRKRAAR
ncbi:MAG: lectin subunit beta [Gammaproteobacteria bacterium HGW-Gammaproteobacteria-6]|jgi:predicted acylesterase/phospholipase RssA|nr:MAG: lectin subunit beta [Gammaproteobacteria bacterium HGW-Gammaproteobacteria-6]PKM16685.1 MAG: lectin subunit beta [Gammaproteobacteria bacterium HGW-Gammaproteobacteria-2]